MSFAASVSCCACAEVSFFPVCAATRSRRSAIFCSGASPAVMSRLQPPEIEPTSWFESSITYRLQVPFGSVPLKTDRDDPYGPAGAGAGNEDGTLQSLLNGTGPVPTVGL